MLIKKLLFIQRSFIRQHQNMVIEITRPLSISTKLKNVASENHDPNANGLSDTYERAISALNALQSNASTIAHSVEQRKHNVQSTHIQETEKYLKRSGIDYSDLDRLSVIHVTGTKGKGSTCAFTESILRAFGVKTGFFSSPHLVSATERIRLNGQSISKDLFAKYFWKVYRSLDKHKEHVDDMPPYFKFLTVMSFHIFLAEKVDVVILEVGIGGEHDCTNVVRNTKTVGITSLGLEHTAILGNTLKDIAWQKSGIIKENSNVLTINQHEECIDIIRKRSAERNAKLHIIPSFKDYRWSNSSTIDTVSNEVQQLNASLGIQLSWDWLRQNSKLIRNPKLIKTLEYNCTEPFLNLTNEFVSGLQNFSWPGRFQILHRKQQRLFIDGAHTIESLKVCLDWFKNKVHGSSNKKFLLFNITGDRDAEAMLQILCEDGIFDFAMFSPNIATQLIDESDDTYTVLPQNHNCKKCISYAICWTKLMDLKLSQDVFLTKSKNTKNSENFDLGKKSSAQVFHCVVDVLSFLDNECATTNESIDVLITGSLHLVGATLAAIDFKK